MSIPPFQLRQCERPSCRFRFPVTDNRQTGAICPHCGTLTQLVLHYLPSERSSERSSERPSLSSPQNAPIIEALLDNLRSVYNVGSVFRTADGAGIRHLHLCGITPLPDHSKIAKTALGAEKSVSWSQSKNGLDTAVSLKQRGYELWAIEESPQSEPLFAAAIAACHSPTLLIVGNEIAGVDPEILALCDRVLHIPMAGDKKSLNVATAFGIAAYFARYGLNER